MTLPWDQNNRNDENYVMFYKTIKIQVNSKTIQWQVSIQKSILIIWDFLNQEIKISMNRWFNFKGRPGFEEIITDTL